MWVAYSRRGGAAMLRRTVSGSAPCVDGRVMRRVVPVPATASPARRPSMPTIRWVSTQPSPTAAPSAPPATPAAPVGAAAAGGGGGGGGSGGGGGGGGGGFKLRGPVSWPTVFLVGVAAAGGVVYYNVRSEKNKAEARRKVETYGQAALGGPWSLVDSSGVPMTSGDLAGMYYLLYFGFTNCPDICPNEMVKMGRVVDALQKRRGVPPLVPVFVTLDPHRDSCIQVGAYVKDFHPRMIGLTGTMEQVTAAARAFRVYSNDVNKDHEDSEDYLVDHSIVMYLVGPDGKFVDFFTQILTVPEIVDRCAAKMVSSQPDQSVWTTMAHAVQGWFGGGSGR